VSWSFFQLLSLLFCGGLPLNWANDRSAKRVVGCGQLLLFCGAAVFPQMVLLLCYLQRRCCCSDWSREAETTSPLTLIMRTPASETWHLAHNRVGWTVAIVSLRPERGGASDERSTDVAARMRATLAFWFSQRPERRSRHGGWSATCGMVLAVAATSLQQPPM
jgi:hypothetical protein